MYHLRPYQIEAKDAVFRMLGSARSTLVEMATGLGKTVLFAHVAQDWPGRVLVIAHRDELIRQAAEKVYQITGRPCEIEMGRDRADDALFGTKVTVGSIQTLSRASRRARFHPDHFSLVIVDEGHHATAQSYRDVLDYFGGAKRLFVSATPKRNDGVGLDLVCDTVAYQYGIAAAIDDGYLVPVQQTVVRVDGLDFSKARTIAGDFSEADLEAIVLEEEPLHRMVGSAYELIGSRQSLWFCVSVAHAKAVAEVLRRYTGDNPVASLSGDTPKDIRRETVSDYKHGRIQHLVNCALFLEGFDAPNTSVIVMARPTKSLSLYMQVLGRGTRTLPGIIDGLDSAEQRRTAIAMSAKPYMSVIDYAGCAGRHKIIQAVDVLGGDADVETRDYARQTMTEEPAKGIDIEEALARARDEMLLEAEQESIRKHIVAKVRYQAYDVSPFEQQYNPTRLTHDRAPVDRCSKKQAGFIAYLSRQCGANWTFAKAAELSARQATGIIKDLKKKAGR